MFWFIAFALAWLVTLPPALAQHGVIASSPIGWGAGALIGLAPAIAAAVAVAREGRSGAFWRGTIRLPRPAWTGLAALLLPPAILAMVYVATEATGAPIRIGTGPDLLVLAGLWLVLAFTEEVGWRSYALPRLAERYGFWAGSLILGIVWCVWHYPRLLSSPYLGSFSEALPLLGLFSVQIVVSNMLLCWLWYRSGRSAIAPTLFHAAFNTVATAYFLAATDWRVTLLLVLALAGAVLIDRNPHRSAAERGPGRP